VQYRVNIVKSAGAGMEHEEMMRVFEDQYKNLVRFDRFLGMDLTVKAPGMVTYILELKDQHLTAPDSAHGGVAAAIMDATLGLAALSYAVTKNNLCATVEFKINYLKPARPGHTLISEGQVKHKGKRLIVSQADIREQQTGQLVATGLGTFTQYPADRRQHLKKIIETDENNSAEPSSA
jgi:uncharacterized protein (TIGR00369 family)